MSKVLLLMFVAIYVIVAVAQENSFPNFKNFPFDFRRFQKDITDSIPYMDVFRSADLGDGRASAIAAYSHNGHGHVVASQDGKVTETSFRK